MRQNASFLLSHTAEHFLSRKVMVVAQRTFRARAELLAQLSRGASADPQRHIVDWFGLAMPPNIETTKIGLINC
jgi:hypothetical protein